MRVKPEDFHILLCDLMINFCALSVVSLIYINVVLE